MCVSALLLRFQVMSCWTLGGLCSRCSSASNSKVIHCTQVRLCVCVCVCAFVCVRAYVCYCLTWVFMRVKAQTNWALSYFLQLRLSSPCVCMWSLEMSVSFFLKIWTQTDVSTNLFYWTRWICLLLSAAEAEIDVQRSSILWCNCERLKCKICDFCLYWALSIKTLTKDRVWWHHEVAWNHGSWCLLALQMKIDQKCLILCVDRAQREHTFSAVLQQFCSVVASFVTFLLI